MAFAFPAIFEAVLAEVFDDDFGLLSEIVRMQRDEPGDGSAGLGAFVLRVVSDGLLDTPIGLVSGVVLQDIEDEALFDSLAHGVQMEGLVPIRRWILGPEHFQGPGLRRGRKGEEGEVLLPGSCPDGPGEGLFDRVDGFGDVPSILDLGGCEFLLFGPAENEPQFLGCLSGLRRVSFIDDDRVSARRKVGNLGEHERKLLQCGDDDAGLLARQRLGQLS